MKFRSVIVGGLVALAIAAAPSSASAAALSGTISIASDNSGGAKVTGAGVIDWFNPLGPPNGIFNIGTPSTGDFAGLLGATGLALDLNFANQPVGVPFPAGAPNSTLPGEGNVLAGFLSFPTAPNIQFDLSFINLGIFSSAQCALAPAPGQVCTPPGGSPFSMFNDANMAANVQFGVKGFVRNTLDGSLSTFTGTYTTQFTVPYQTLLIDLLALPAGGLFPGSPACGPSPVGDCGFVQNTYSGTFTATVTPVVPEPMTLLTFGAGSLFIARKRRKAAKKN
jgi:hypothetical protein